jgi:hypothetical protein
MKRIPGYAFIVLAVLLTAPIFSAYPTDGGGYSKEFAEYLESLNPAWPDSTALSPFGSAAFASNPSIPSAEYKGCIAETNDNESCVFLTWVKGTQANFDTLKAKLDTLGDAKLDEEHDDYAGYAVVYGTSGEHYAYLVYFKKDAPDPDYGTIPAGVIILGIWETNVDD